MPDYKPVVSDPSFITESNDGKYVICVCPCSLAPKFHYRVWEPQGKYKIWTVTGTWQECLNHVLNKIRTYSEENKEFLWLRNQTTRNT